MIDILEDLRGGLAVSCRPAEDSLLPTQHIVALAHNAVIGGSNASASTGSAVSFPRHKSTDHRKLAAIEYGVMFVAVGFAITPVLA